MDINGWIVVFIIVLIFYSIARMNRMAYEDYLYGFWTADGDEFCENAEINSMMMFIGEIEASERFNDFKWWNCTRGCYVIIMDDIANQGFTLTYRPGWTGVGIGVYRVRATAEFDEPEFPLWEGEVCVDVDIVKGTLQIHSDGTVYAKLHRQNDISNAAKMLEAAKMV